MTNKSELHRAALEYAAKGWALIPVALGQKIALEKNWNAAANKLQTAEQVDAYFAEHGDVNLAICPEDLGLAVIDADTYKPDCDVARWQIPDTFEVETPKQGTHYYLVGSVPPTVGKEGKHLGPGIDTRGRGSYVLVPPSIVDGKCYRIKANRGFAALPAEIEAAVLPRADAVQSDVHELDLPGNVTTAKQRVADKIKRNEVAVSGRGGNNATYQLACELVRDLGLSSSKTFEVMQPWNEACVPPWAPDDLATIIHNAGNYGQNEAGAYASKPAAETFANANLPRVASPDTAPKGVRLRAISFDKLAERKAKDVAELVPGLIERGIATMLAGPGGVHKSRVAQHFGLCIQAGQRVFGRAVERCAFIYLDYENGADEVTRRTQKMRERLKLPSLDNAHYQDFKTQGEAIGAVPAYEAAPALATVRDDAIEVEPLYYEVFEYLRSIPGHKFVVLDSTYNVLRFVGQSKVNETAVKAALNLLDHLCGATNSTILYLWHPSQAGMERGDASGWSVAWHNTPRARLSLSKDDKAKDTFDLKVEKRNNGRQGEVITLHWCDGILQPRSELEAGEQGALFFEACVTTAVQAAANEDPITKQKRLYDWQLDDIERQAGFRPSQNEIKEQLALAVSRARLRYLKGYGKQRAGFYPRETDPAWMRDFGEDTARLATTATSP
ncbi:MAG TPA: bifunctional DNA primase/polymerase [Pseudolabrys sp.]|nr:bifunctional DNA primase/polymerase [Pseudolabrys sp.]